MTKEEKAKLAEAKQAEKEAKKAEKEAAKKAKAERKAKLAAMTPEEKKEFLAQEKAEKIAKYEAKEAEHKQKIDQKRAEIEKSGSGWKKFWFNFSQWGLWQAIRRGWSKFCCLHPVLSDWIWKIFFFIVFSEGVTIWQYLVMVFLPNAFTSLGTDPWGWPMINTGLQDKNGSDIFFVLFGDTQGLGYFLAFEIAVFTAQCINFPLQRNITYKSHGNPWWQAMWYFIGWVAISILVNACWGGVNILMQWWRIPDALAGLLKTFITGGLSMVVFFFIFMIIFPSDKKEESK